MIDPMDTDSIIEKLACEQVEKILSNGIILRQQARIKVLEAKLKIIAMDSTAEDLSIKVSADRIEELEAKIEHTSKMLPRALSAVYKDRKQEAIDVLETAIAELTGGKDG